MDNEILVKILERLSAIETSIKDLSWVKKDVHQNSTDITELKLKVENMQKEIEEIKNGTKWLIRTVIGMGITLTIAGIRYLFGF